MMASKRRVRRNGCRGKVRHQTQEGAFIAAAKMNRKHRLDLAIGVHSVRPYRCQFCGSFHIGHNGK